jgi:hypothetical protein
MADLSQTAANVKPGENITPRMRQAGEAITQGMPYYVSTTDSKAYQTDANDGAAKAEVRGIALTGAALDGYFVAQESGLINLGATLAVGTVYVVSATKGAICPIADITSGQYVSPLGVATTTSLLNLKPDPSGVTKA